MMELSGRVKGLVKDFVSGKWQITFEIDEEAVLKAEYDKVAKLDRLLIKVSKWRQKRSLDANAYAWVLMTKIGNVMNISKDEVYEQMLQRYGTIYQDDEGYVVATFPAKVDISKIEGHWMLYKDSGKFKAYLMIKGSSQYDTKEMSSFIDGIVSEAKELGIETLTPDELERMKLEWQRNEKVS